MRMSEKVTLIGFDLMYLAAPAVVAKYGDLPEIPTVLFPFALALAANRLGLAMTDNLVGKPLRDAVGIVEVKDSSGAGGSTEATGVGPKRIVAELLSCPICSGTFAATTLLVIYAVAPAYGRALIYILAAAAISEALVYLFESLKWVGRAAREVSGSYWLAKNPQHGLPGNGKVGELTPNGLVEIPIEMERIKEDA